MPDAVRSDAQPLLDRLAEHTESSSRYSVKGEIARGGMGVILHVWDEDLSRDLAMKVVSGKSTDPNGDTTGVDGKTLGRFLEEAQITGMLEHPGIIPVHELGADARGRLYFTMRLVRGRDLKAIFTSMRYWEEDWMRTRALGLLLKACEALAYAHSKGVVHRDIKPGNIMVGRFGQVYVMDWGLARVLGRKDLKDIRLQREDRAPDVSRPTRPDNGGLQASESPLVTMDGDVVGTPAYMSPEQARGEIDAVGPRSDVYSMGAILYELLTRRMPFVPIDMNVSPRTILDLVLQGPPTPIRELDPNAPEELVSICERAMARNAADRYPDVIALASDLQAYLENRVVAVHATGALAELRKWVARNRALAASLAIAVLLAGGMTASLLFHFR